MEHQEYCFYCHRNEQYEVYEKPTTVEYRGIPVKYIELEARCSCCHNIIEVDSIWDENLARLKKAFCEQQHRANKDDLHYIKNNYRVSERTIALLVGCGEATMKRYCAGELPSFQFSERILQIKNSPTAFLQSLMRCRGNIPVAQFNRAVAIAHGMIAESSSFTTECTIAEIPKKELLFNVCFA